MQYIKREDIKANGIYKATVPSMPNSYIIRIKNNRSYYIIDYISIKGKPYSRGGSVSPSYAIEPATVEQVRWLEACEEARKFIPLKEAKGRLYEIY